MTVLGPLHGEPPEAMTKEDFERVRLRTSWNGSVTPEKKMVEQLLNEIIWLKRRLHGVESAIQPVADSLAKTANVKNAIFDGEIIVMTKALPDFCALMFRRGTTEYAAFDL